MTTSPMITGDDVLMNPLYWFGAYVLLLPLFFVCQYYYHLWFTSPKDQNFIQEIVANENHPFYPICPFCSNEEGPERLYRTFGGRKCDGCEVSLHSKQEVWRCPNGLGPKWCHKRGFHLCDRCTEIGITALDTYGPIVLLGSNRKDLNDSEQGANGPGPRVTTHHIVELSEERFRKSTTADKTE